MNDDCRNVRVQPGASDEDFRDWLERMVPVLRATVEVELMRKRALGLPISYPTDEELRSGPLSKH